MNGWPSGSAIQVGDVVTLIPPKPPKVNAALGIAVPQLWQYEVTGIFNTGMFQYDNQFVVMSLPAAQQFTGMGNAVSGIEIRLRNPDTAPAVGERLEEKLGYPYPLPRLAEPERGPVQRAATGEDRHGPGDLLHHDRGSVQHRGHAHHGGDRQDPGDRHPAGDGT